MPAQGHRIVTYSASGRPEKQYSSHAFPWPADVQHPPFRTLLYRYFFFDWLFQDAGHGNVFERAAAAAGIPVTLHALRHTAAYRMEMGRVASDASFRRIRERLLPAAQRAALGQARASWEPAHLV